MRFDMKNFIVALCVLLSLPAHVAASVRSDDRMRAILYLCGADSEEELDEQEVQRFSAFLSHPLEINLASGSRIASSGLMSQYQVASLLDYRSRNGDVLSVSELALIDGFGNDFADALKPFVSFVSVSLPGAVATDSNRVSQEALTRVAAKGDAFSYGARYRMGCGDNFEFSSSAGTKYSDKDLFPPSSWSVNMTLYGRRRPGKVMVGDFNTRFGQGLVLWSGMSLSGLTVSSSFYRRPTGLSPSRSWSGIGSHRGVAADFVTGRTVLTAFVSFPGLRRWCESGKEAEISLMAGANITRHSRNGQFSLTGYGLTSPMNARTSLSGGKVSGDFRYSWRGVDFFGEAAWDFSGKCPGVVLGCVAALGDEWKLSSAAHCYSSGFSSEQTGGIRSWTKTSDEYGLAFGVERSGAFVSLDLAARCSERSVRQARINLTFPFQMTDRLVTTVRITERVRPYEPVLKYRTGARLDMDWSSAGLSARYGPSDKPSWRLRTRAEGLLCRSLAGLAYLDGGRKTDGYSVWMRGTVFIVDNWDDRIYSYERDAPGNFTVPAYYGRGWSLSAFAGCKIRLGKRTYKALKLYLRASYIGYSFMERPKPSVSEVKVQAVMTL